MCNNQILRHIFDLFCWPRQFICISFTIKDPKRQRDKCDLIYENLLEDIDELDNDLNQKMTESEDDFLDSYEYKDMSRRKRKLMQEKKALEAFQKQFDEETQVNLTLKKEF